MSCAEDIELIILTWNRIGLLREALESALRQTVAPHRIIVLDNASTDGTSEYVESVTRHNRSVRHVRQPNHVDVCSNMLTAVGEVKTKYFMMMHDDDILDGNCIAWLDLLLKAEPDVAMAYSAQKTFHRLEECVDFAGRTLEYEVMPLLGDFVAADFARFLTRQVDSMCFPSVLYRRETVSTDILRNNRFGKILDRPFVYDSIGRGSIVRLRTPLYHYRIHSGQDTSTSKNGPYPEEIFNLITLQRDVLSENRVYERMFAALSIRLMKSLYFWGGNPKGGWRGFVREARRMALTSSAFARPWRVPFWKQWSNGVCARLLSLAMKNSSVRAISMSSEEVVSK